MSEFISSIRLSYQELKKPRTITTVALLVALKTVLGLVTVIPSEFMKISVGYLVTAATGFLFGPVPALLGAAANDLIGYVLRPTGPYFFGFTFNEALAGFLYGALLYRRPARLWRCAVTKGAVSLIVNVALNTLWLGVLYGKSISVLLPARALKNAVSLPVEALLMWMVLAAVGKAWSRARAVRA